MKKKGKIDNTSLQRLGLDVEIKEQVHEENQGGGVDLDSIKNRQKKEMRDFNEREQNAQKDRENKIQLTQDEEERSALT